jgi:hypothetical protein
MAKWDKELIAMGMINVKELREKKRVSTYDKKNKIALSIFQDKKGRWWIKAELLTKLEDENEDNSVPF